MPVLYEWSVEVLSDGVYVESNRTKYLRDLNVDPKDVVARKKQVILTRKVGNHIDGYKEIHIAIVKVQKVGDFELMLPLHFDNGIQVRC